MPTSSTPSAESATRFPLRAARAARTRSRILSSAGALFASNGYGLTSMKAIAEHAGVSVESVYAAGSKATLLRLALDRSFHDAEGAETMAERDEILSLFAQPDLDAVLDGYVATVVPAIARSFSLWRAARAAADADPEIAALWQRMIENRQHDFDAVGPWLVGRGLVAADRVDEAVASWSVLAAHETYEHLVERFGWTQERYAAWFREALVTLVLRSQPDRSGAPAGPARSGAPPTRATPARPEH